MKKRESRLKEGGMKEKWINCGEWMERGRDPTWGKKCRRMDLDMALSFPFRIILDLGKNTSSSHDIQMVSFIASLQSLLCLIMHMSVVLSLCCFQGIATFPPLYSWVAKSFSKAMNSHPIVKTEVFVPRPRLGFTSLLIDDDDDRTRKKDKLEGRAAKSLRLHCGGQN